MWDVVMESVTYLDNCWLINKMMVIPNLDNISPSSIGSFLGLGKVKARRAFQRETHEQVSISSKNLLWDVQGNCIYTTITV